MSTYVKNQLYVKHEDVPVYEARILANTRITELIEWCDKLEYRPINRPDYPWQVNQVPGIGAVYLRDGDFLIKRPDGRFDGMYSDNFRNQFRPLISETSAEAFERAPFPKALSDEEAAALQCRCVADPHVETFTDRCRRLLELKEWHNLFVMVLNWRPHSHQNLHNGYPYCRWLWGLAKDGIQPFPIAKLFGIQVWAVWRPSSHYMTAEQSDMMKRFLQQQGSVHIVVSGDVHGYRFIFTDFNVQNLPRVEERRSFNLDNPELIQLLNDLYVAEDSDIGHGGMLEIVYRAFGRELDR